MISHENGRFLNDLLLEQGAFRMAVELHLFELPAAVGAVFNGKEHEAPVILDSSRAELGLLELDAPKGFDGVDVELSSSLAYVSGNGNWWWTQTVVIFILSSKLNSNVEK